MPHSIPRGLLRFLIMKLLNSNEMTGTEIIHTLAERSDGKWQPSPGSIYPMLAALDDEGLIETARTEGRSKTYRVSEEGHTHLKVILSQKGALEHKARLGRKLWIQLLEPADQVHFHITHMDSSVGLLTELVESLTRTERERLREHIEKIKGELSALANTLKHGGSIDD